VHIEEGEQIMITEKLHQELEKRWAKVGAGVYQKRSRVHRLEFFLKHIHHFKGKSVCELGCNAGLYGYEIAKVAESYVGVDKGDYYHDQALVTKEYIRNHNVEFIQGNIKDFIKLDIAGKVPKYNALFSSFALYHFSQKEVDRIAETMLPKCSVVIISTRTKKRTPFRPYNKMKFEKPENVVNYLERAGFACKVHWPNSKKYALIVGLK